MNLKNYKYFLSIGLLSIAHFNTIEAQKTKTPISYWTVAGTDTLLKKVPINYSSETIDQPKEVDAFVFIDSKHQFQQLIGFGGAITDASAEVFAKLSKPQQVEFLKAYYGKNDDGLNYDVVRTNIASCDFSSDTYNYVQENDKDLKTFSIAHDEKYRIPLLQQAAQYIGKDQMKLFVSPWSPPAWMKDNNSVVKGGHLLKEYYGAWANYFVKYIQALESRNLPVWGLTVQNEPMAVQTWESCQFSAEMERDFIKNNLGPTLWKNGMKDKKMIVWDHNRDLIYQYASTILNDPEAAKYVWGTGIHWYETWNSKVQLFQNEVAVKQSFPDKHLIFTEGCLEKFDYSKIMDKKLGELYGNNILNDLNSGVEAWTDWNILLDQNGGPNHVGNYCFAPVIADLDKKEVVYTLAYYYIGQFSKYIKPGAKRIATSTNVAKLGVTSFQNIDGSIATIVLNQSDETLKYKLLLNKKVVEVTSSPHSIGTILL
ncbi:glycoside hydrolase family 30 protein [Rhizosphaericola mali]|uniref:Glycosyl hydrolase n=1 Tax=Rhizosphaericola mali TaxID=2545455 RepID=A0A5P2G2G9_9BACT|nr:glycoside hydrolase family 30 protein [Rhizosphaericola mali]QES88010.1 glycosyl hydrolase [Rhizosphaericola mali]